MLEFSLEPQPAARPVCNWASWGQRLRQVMGEHWRWRLAWLRWIRFSWWTRARFASLYADKGGFQVCELTDGFPARHHRRDQGGRGAGAGSHHP